MKKFIILTVVLISVVAYAMKGGGGEQPEYRSFSVERGSVIREAVAVGRIEPRFEIPVKSTTGGVMTQRFVELGERVKEGDPLAEVRPVLTDNQRLRAERALLGAAEALEGAKEMSGGDNLAGMAMKFLQGGKSLNRMQASAQRSQVDASKQLELLLNGQAEIDGKVIDYVVRAPIDGHVITTDVEVGQPVVPSSIYGSGTMLLTLADLNDPIFRGTVDEIDVGRLKVGIPANMTIGALPGESVSGVLREISLKALRVDNAVTFEVELDVHPPEDLVLRSGYSAVAHIILEEATDVLVLPERLIHFQNESGAAFVLIPDADGGASEQMVELGLSDSLTIEIIAGIAEGDIVLERI